MYSMKTSQNHKIVLYVSLVFFIITGLLLLVLCQNDARPAMHTDDDEDWEKIINELFDLRNECILNQDMDTIESIFLTNEKNGRWAYEFEVQRTKYLFDWAVKQGIDITGIDSKIKIKSVKQVGRGYSFYLVSSNEYEYAYKDDPQTKNMFRLGAYHSLDLIPNEADDSWVISRQWYDDPLLDSINLENVTDEMTAYITSHESIDISGISEQRVKAVEYADRYCGAASDGQNNYEYNSEYTNYNPLGGDCANFASQVLLAGGFKKNGTWNYTGGKGSRAWVNAQGLKDYLLYSGRASLLAGGSYKEIYQYAYSLRPGDIVAYVKKGKVTHVSVVTGADSKGYPLVSCHNLDRYRVPWDIGWSGDNVRFFLLNVSY